VLPSAAINSLLSNDGDTFIKSDPMDGSEAEKLRCVEESTGKQRENPDREIQNSQTTTIGRFTERT
jgi:hypothetical protein